MSLLSRLGCKAAKGEASSSSRPSSQNGASRAPPPEDVWIETLSRLGAALRLVFGLVLRFVVLGPRRPRRVECSSLPSHIGARERRSSTPVTLVLAGDVRGACSLRWHAPSSGLVSASCSASRGERFTVDAASGAPPRSHVVARSRRVPAGARGRRVSAALAALLRLFRFARDGRLPDGDLGDRHAQSCGCAGGCAAATERPSCASRPRTLVK